MSTPINIDGHAVVIGDDDHLIVAVRGLDVDGDEAAALAGLLTRHLGERWVVIAGDIELGVVRGAEDAPDNEIAEIAELWTSAGAVVADISPRRWRFK